MGFVLRQQSAKPLIGTQGGVNRIQAQIVKLDIVLIDGFFQPGDGLVAISQTVVYPRDNQGADMILGSGFERSQNIACIGGLLPTSAYA